MYHRKACNWPYPNLTTPFKFPDQFAFGFQTVNRTLHQLVVVKIYLVEVKKQPLKDSTHLNEDKDGGTLSHFEFHPCLMLIFHFALCLPVWGLALLSKTQFGPLLPPLHSGRDKIDHLSI